MVLAVVGVFLLFPAAPEEEEKGGKEDHGDGDGDRGGDD